MADLLQQAVIAHRANNLPEAERLYEAVFSTQPLRADARYNYGVLQGQSGRPLDAVRELQEAVRLKPDFSEAWFMLCEFADETRQYDVSLLAGEAVTLLMPENPRAWFRYGLALSRVEREDDAIAAYRRALDLDPKMEKVSVNLSVVLKNMNRVKEAEEVLQQALDRTGQRISDEGQRYVDEGEYKPLYWNLSLTELTLGKYREGFAHFRVRFESGMNWRRLDADQPLWRGEDLHGKVILISAEGGHGDALMMARYLPLLKAKGAKVLFLAHPALVPFLAPWDGADKILPLHQPLSEAFDYHASIFDLPHVFQHTVESIPADMPYLPVPVVDDRFRLPRDGRPAIGVIWGGEAAHQNDKMRTLPLALYADLFAEKDFQFFNLTRDFRPGEEDLLGRLPVANVAPLIRNFSDSAKLMAQMDLIITCDSAPAHLAGGMGKETWTLLPFASDWRWLLERETTPWYPSMRLFRQKCRGSWGDVLHRVRGELQKAGCSWSNKGHSQGA